MQTKKKKSGSTLLPLLLLTTTGHATPVGQTTENSSGATLDMGGFRICRGAKLLLRSETEKRSHWKKWTHAETLRLH